MDYFGSDDESDDDMYGDDEIGGFTSDESNETDDDDELSQLSELSFESSQEIESDDDTAGCCHWSREQPDNATVAIEPFEMKTSGKNAIEFPAKTTQGNFSHTYLSYRF